jgi:hypothetical protein
MINNLLKTAIIISIIFFLSSVIHAQETYNLQYKFIKDNSYSYNSDVNLQMTQEVMGKEMKVNSNIHGVIRFKVDDVVDNGDIYFTTAMDSATLKSNASGKDTAVSLTGLIGKRVKCVISKFGEVKDCTMIDTIDDLNSRMMNIQQEVKRYFSTFAGKDIKIGDSWNSSATDTTRNYSGDIISIVDMTYTLSGKENKLGRECFKIPFSGKIKISGKGNMQGTDFNLDGDGTSSGTFYFDGNAGILVYTDGTMDDDITIATTGEQSMVIPITQNLKYSNSLVNK